MTAPATSSRAGILSLLLLASTLSVMAGSVLSPVVELIRGDLGLSGTAVGLIVTAHSLGIAVASPLAGRLLDRAGIRAPLAAGLVVYGLAGGIGGLVNSYPLLLVTRLVFGAGASLVFAGTTVALLTLFQGRAKDRAMGWRATATSLGGVLWPLAAGAVGGISWHLPFAIYLIGVPLGIATFFVLPRAEPAGGAPDRRMGALALLRRHRILLAWYGLQFLSSLLLYALIVFLPQQLAAAGVESPMLVSLYTMGMSAVMSLVGLAYAPLRTKLGELTLLHTGVALWAVAFLLLATTGQPVLLFMAPVLFGLGQGLFFPVVTVLVGEGVPEAVRGQATSLSGTATFAGQFLSPLLVGPLLASTGTGTGFFLVATLPALALAALLFARTSLSGAASPNPTTSAPAPSRTGTLR
ncbi:MFS transporter [Parasphingorhabdus pacifica]